MVGWQTMQRTWLTDWRSKMNDIMRMFSAKVMADVDDILKEMSTHKEDFHEAINWADLKCVDVELISSSYSGDFIRVKIEEAAPDSSDFRMYIYQALVHRGYLRIEVVTEW